MDHKNFQKSILKKGLESVKVDTLQNIPLPSVARYEARLIAFYVLEFIGVAS